MWFLAVPFCTGLFVTGKMEEEKESFLLTMLCGYAGMFAVFEIMTVPMIFLRLSFSMLKYSYGAVILALAGISAVCERKRILPLIWGKIKKIREIPWTCLAAAVLIVLQIGVYAVGMSTDLDDSFYVGTATTAIETDTMYQYSAYTGNAVKSLPSRYVLSPFPVMLAFYSEAVGMSPAAVAHTVMPLFFIALAYGVYMLIGRRLFR